MKGDASGTQKFGLVARNCISQDRVPVPEIDFEATSCVVNSGDRPLDKVHHITVVEHP